MAIRLIPITDDADFPYTAAVSMLRDMETEDVNFPAMIEAGQRVGWPQQMVDSHWALMERGNCFDFHQSCSPELHGTMYEDNIWFSFFSAEHEAGCMPVIEEMAQVLNVRVLIV